MMSQSLVMLMIKSSTGRLLGRDGSGAKLVFSSRTRRPSFPHRVTGDEIVCAEAVLVVMVIDDSKKKSTDNSSSVDANDIMMLKLK